MPSTAAPCDVSYQLLIEVDHALQLEIGRLGTFAFPAGRYVYTGSARRALDARIARHLRREKTLRWHIDYLLAAPGVRVAGVLSSSRDECALNRAVHGRIDVPGFGASDCRQGCGAHLKRVRRGGGPRVGRTFTSRRQARVPSLPSGCGHCGSSRPCRPATGRRPRGPRRPRAACRKGDRSARRRACRRRRRG